MARGRRPERPPLTGMRRTLAWALIGFVLLLSAVTMGDPSLVGGGLVAIDVVLVVAAVAMVLLVRWRR
jgi:hypothetical protein